MAKVTTKVRREPGVGPGGVGAVVRHPAGGTDGRSTSMAGDWAGSGRSGFGGVVAEPGELDQDNAADLWRTVEMIMIARCQTNAVLDSLSALWPGGVRLRAYSLGPCAIDQARLRLY